MFFIVAWHDSKSSIIVEVPESGEVEFEFGSDHQKMLAIQRNGAQWDMFYGGKPVQGVEITWVEPLGDEQNFYDFVPVGGIGQRFGWVATFANREMAQDFQTSLG